MNFSVKKLFRKTLRLLLLKSLGFTNKNYCDHQDDDTLFVRLTDKCANHCEYCLDRTCPHGQILAPAKSLAYRTGLIDRPIVQISGGDPCIDMDRLNEYIDLIDEKYIVYIDTSLPKTTYMNKDILCKAIERSKIFNISICGTTNEDDENVYGIHLNYDKQNLIAELLQKYSDKIYISCVMTKGKFNDINDLKKIIRHYYDLGARNFYFREAGDVRPANNDFYVSFNEILKNSGMNEFKSYYAYGCRHDISNMFKDEFKGILVLVKHWCYFQGGYRLETWQDKLKYIINAKLLDRMATPVLNENGIISQWYLNK